MSCFRTLLRVLGFLSGGFLLLVGLLLLFTEGLAQAFSQLLLGSMFLAYGIGGNSGYRRFLMALALPLLMVGLIWFGHELWVAATEWKTSNMSGEGSIPLLTQPFLFSVVVWGKLVMFATCSIGLAFVTRFSWLRRTVL
jgi:hypothetical protein